MTLVGDLFTPTGQRITSIKDVISSIRDRITSIIDRVTSIRDGIYHLMNTCNIDYYFSTEFIAPFRFHIYFSKVPPVFGFAS